MMFLGSTDYFFCQRIERILQISWVNELFFCQRIGQRIIFINELHQFSRIIFGQRIKRIV